jgi:hypothetical protein
VAGDTRALFLGLSGMRDAPEEEQTPHKHDGNQPHIPDPLTLCPQHIVSSFPSLVPLSQCYQEQSLYNCPLGKLIYSFYVLYQIIRHIRKKNYKIWPCGITAFRKAILRGNIILEYTSLLKAKVSNEIFLLTYKNIS